VSSEDALLRQYVKTVDLYMHEDRIAWELVSIYLALQVGIVSAIALLFTQYEAYLGTFRYALLFFAGGVSSLFFFFALYRSLMWRENWYLAGLRIERQLDPNPDLPDFGIFGIMRRSRSHDKWKLKLFNDEDFSFRNIRFRDQRLRERGGALKLFHVAMLIFSILWFIFMSISLYFRLR
jgi:hypothetical protein